MAEEEKPKNPEGRPLAELPEEKVKQLAERQWTTVQIGAFFGVADSTVQRRFGAKLNEWRQRGKAKLLDMLWAGAAKGNERLLIHMAKQYLDHTDKTEFTIAKIPDDALAAEVAKRVEIKATGLLPTTEDDGQEP